MQFIEMAKIYHKTFGFNVLPIQGKRPTIPWDNWQIIEQTENDVISLGWNSTATGIGGVCGINELRNIDFDNVTDPGILEMISKRLGVGEKYSWTIKSGSGVGYHIWFKVHENEFLHKQLHGPKSVYRLYLKDEGICDHIELRWKQSQTVLPYSLHDSGNRYSFLYVEPNQPPIDVSADVLIECLDEYCDLKKEREVLEVGKRTFEPASFDKEKLESAVEFLENNLPTNCYDEWYRVGFALTTIGEEGRKYFLQIAIFI